MSTNDRAKSRKNRIAEMDTGSGITDISLKQSIDVINSVLEDITKSIDKSSKSSDRLSLIVAICTALLVSIGASTLYIRIFDICAKCP